MQEYIGRMTSQMLINPRVEVSVGFPYINNITVRTFGDENANFIFILLRSFWQRCAIFFCVYPEYLPIYGNLEYIQVLSFLLKLV